MFYSYLNSAHPLLDLEYAPNPMTYKFHFRVDNNSGISRYIQVVSTIPNWSVTSPSEGKLGAVGGAETKHFGIVLSRTLPGSPIDDSGQLIMKVFSDAAYTILIEQNPLDVTMSTVNVKGGTYTEYNFNDGTLQGWTTNGGVSTEEFMGVSGYSVRMAAHNLERYMNRSHSIPSGAKAAGMFYFKLKNIDTGTMYGLSRLWVKVNGVYVWDWYLNFTYESLSPMSETPWRKIVFDLTPYIGMSKTIEIRTDPCNGNFIFFVDNVVIGAWG